MGKEPVVATVTQGEESSGEGQSQGLGECLVCTFHRPLSLLDRSLCRNVCRKGSVESACLVLVFPNSVWAAQLHESGLRD